MSGGGDSESNGRSQSNCEKRAGNPLSDHLSPLTRDLGVVPSRTGPAGAAKVGINQCQYLTDGMTGSPLSGHGLGPKAGGIGDSSSSRLSAADWCWGGAAGRAERRCRRVNATWHGSRKNSEPFCGAPSIAGLVESLLGLAEAGEVFGEGSEVVDEPQGGGGVVVAGESSGDGDEPGHGA